MGVFAHGLTHKTMIIKELRITELYLVAALSILISCQSRHCGNFSESEKALILGADSIMRVLTIADPADSIVLRALSADLSPEALLSDEFERLSELMIATVTHPSQDGVGIAGPQVGLNRRIVAVQRFDKEPVEWGGRIDHPFEVYPNLRIVWKSDSLAYGPEGCLSVPDRRGEVLRAREIIIEYADLAALRGDSEKSTGCYSKGLADSCDCKFGEAVPMVRDTIRGFTAVIFQHEVDHLDGVLYIDRL